MTATQFSPRPSRNDLVELSQLTDLPVSTIQSMLDHGWNIVFDPTRSGPVIRAFEPPAFTRSALTQEEVQQHGAAIQETLAAMSNESTDGEVRVTSSTGGQKGVKPETFAFVPVKPLMAVARIYGKGAEKYDETPDKPNWRKGYEYSKSYNAALRHLLSFWGGEDLDPEMKESHLAAVVFHCFSLMVFQDEHPEFDDRYKNPLEREANA